MTDQSTIASYLAQGARAAMEYLSSSQLDEDHASRIPYILMTNGGGRLQSHRAAQSISRAVSSDGH
jgi:ribonucleotide monophosphatase NagD (HAD superfamily)